MPTRSYSLQRGAKKRLAVSWKGVYQELSVQLDGETVGNADKEEAVGGKEFKLSDGSTLELRLENGSLHLERNGESIPGSSGDPMIKMQTASMVLAMISAVNLVVGIALLAMEPTYALKLGIGPGLIGFGAVLGACALMGFKNSVLGLLVGAVVLFIDGLAGVIASFGSMAFIGGAIAKWVMIVAVWKGYEAAKMYLLDDATNTETAD